MPNFEYVCPAKTKPVRSELHKIILEVQDMVRNDFTFQFRPVGSSSRNMITCDKNCTIGFDFDYDFEINDDEENYSPKEIHNIIKNSLNRIAPKYGYGYCEESTRVLTIKKINRVTGNILHSCDFALVYNCDNGEKQYIRFNKENGNCTWEIQGNGFKNLEQKIKWLKSNGYWGELRDYYLDKKNYNNNPHKHSRSILAESVNEMYNKKRV